MLRTRRELVAGATLAAGMAAVPDVWASHLLSTGPRIGAGTFQDSVASGDPAPDAVTFWSRLTTDRPKSGAELIVARDPGLRQVVANVTVPTGEAMDHCLKARVGGLAPATIYHYAWRSGDDVSPVGRTRTASDPTSNDAVRVACSSCQNFDEGYFTGLTHAAAQDPWDLVVFMGDYTYETPGSGRRDDPANSNDLGSYRDKLRLYRTDAGLRELHRLHPIAHTWDDHEVAENYTNERETTNPDKTLPSRLQIMAGYRASFEWLPRLAVPSDRYRIYRPLRLGRTAEVIMLDERQYRDRSRAGAPGNQFDEVTENPLLGRVQMDFLKARLRQLQAEGVKWKVLGNQLPVFPINAIAQTGLQNDQWHGFQKERNELLGFIEAEGIKNVVFVTGDIHTFIVSELNQDFEALDAGAKPSIAVDYVCGSITSGGLGGTPEQGTTTTSPHIKQFNGSVRGYGALTMNGERLVTDFVSGPIDKPDAELKVIERFTEPIDTSKVTRESNPPQGRREEAVARAAARDGGRAEKRKRSGTARRRRAAIARHHRRQG